MWLFQAIGRRSRKPRPLAPPVLPLAGAAAAAAMVLTTAIVVPVKGFAADPVHCLGAEDERAAIASGKAVPFASVIRTLHRAPKDVIGARLCQEGDRLIYLLTLLGRDGKVRRASIDAASGAVVGER
jgi:uncharacterized membrane protein YkoI